MSELSAEQLSQLNTLMDSFYNERNDAVLSEVFALFDRNNNGRLEASELQTVMSQVSGERVPESEVRDMINEADANKNGVIELSEFINIMKKHRD